MSYGEQGCVLARRCAERIWWLGHVFRMFNDRLSKKLLFGQVKGKRLLGSPRSTINNVSLRDSMAPQQTVQRCSGQTTLERQYLPCTYLAQYELESVNIIVICR